MLVISGVVDGRCDMKPYSSSNGVHLVAVCVVVYELHMGCIHSSDSYICEHNMADVLLTLSGFFLDYHSILDGLF